MAQRSVRQKGQVVTAPWTILRPIVFPIPLCVVLCMSPTILICGATGTVGTVLTNTLIERGVPVRAFVRDRVRAQSLRHPLVDLVEGDFRQPRTLDAALAGIDRVFLLSPAALNQVTLQGNVVEAAQRTGREIHLVKVSVYGAAPEAPSPFVRWHAITEAQITNTGLPATFLRPHFFMQNLLTAAPALREEGVLYGAFGNAALPLIDATDVAAVAAEVLTGKGHEGQAYTLTGPESLTYTDVAATFTRVLGQSVTYVDLPPERYRSTLLSAGMPGWLADGLMELARSCQTTPSPRATSTVAQLVGRPARSLEAFVYEHTDAFRPPARAVA